MMEDYIYVINNNKKYCIMSKKKEEKSEKGKNIRKKMYIIHHIPITRQKFEILCRYYV